MIPRTLVIDASVAAKWVLNEPGRDKALRLLRMQEDGETLLLAPRLLLLEVGSVIWKTARRGALSAHQAQQAFDQLVLRAPRLISGTDLDTSALRLALAHGLSVYDGAYLAVSVERQCDLVTADAKLFRAVHRALPFVHLLDSYEIR